MKLTDLRALAMYHAQFAANQAQMADGMGPCPVADDARANARRHSEWALKIDELADAMEGLLRACGQ